MFVFRRNYFLIAALLFVIELLIALFVHDRIIRPYVGDFLVVIFLYCLARAFFNFPIGGTAIAVLIFAYLIEFLQYLNILYLLKLQDSKLANLVLGNLFEWIDLLAYTLGIALVLLFEKVRSPGSEAFFPSRKTERRKRRIH